MSAARAASAALVCVVLLALSTAPRLACASSGMDIYLPELSACFPTNTLASTCEYVYSTRGAAIKQCSESINITDTGMKNFICGLAKFKYYAYIDNCQQKYCLGPMNSSFGNQLRAAIQAQSSAKGCSAALAFDSSTRTLASCYQPDLYNLFQQFFSLFCFRTDTEDPLNFLGAGDAQYLLSVSACYPPGAGVDVNPPNPNVACANMTATSACVQAVNASQASANAQYVASLIFLKYATDCDPKQACAQAASYCFAAIGSFTATDGSTIFTEKQLCADQTVLQACLKATFCDPATISVIVTFVQTTCTTDGY